MMALKLKGKQLTIFMGVLARARGEHARELEIIEHPNCDITIKWHFGSMIRGIRIGSRGGLGRDERAWYTARSR